MSSWSDDTDKLLVSGTVVTVKQITSTYLSGSVYPTTSTSIIETATVLIFPKNGDFKKEIKGRIVENTHLLFFPSTSSVAVGQRAYESGSADFYEVLDVRNYNGHKQVYAEKVENR